MPTEFEFIQNLKQKYGLRHVGDDCAVLPKDASTDQVVTADMLVENVDFRLEWTTPEALGHKALAVSLSDIAAMGAEPKWAMVSIAAPERLWSTGFVERFYEGWFGLAREYGVELVGGDVSGTPDGLVIDSIVGGEVPRGKAVLRSGAGPGDSIYVIGSLGGSAGGLALLERGVGVTSENAKIIEKQLKPQPQVELGKLLQELQIATSLIDISDGLSSDLAHICEASDVGARIYAERLPVNKELRTFFADNEAFLMALNGGEDFELIFTSREKNISLPENVQITRIGEVIANVEIIELIDGEKSVILEPKGYRHF
jgi:thiamine-monophosphate kinase